MLKAFSIDRSDSKAFVNRNEVYGESSASVLDDAKVKAALEKEEEWHKKSKNVEVDDRRRTYNSMQTVIIILQIKLLTLITGLLRLD